MLSSLQITQINNLLDKIKPNDEFEVMFNNYRSNNKLSFIKFIDLLYFIKYRAENKNLSLINETTLDIIYNYIDNNVYRITINGIEKINSILNTVHQRKNHIIFSILCSRFNDDKDINYMNKQKEFGNIIDIDDYDLRFRISNEINITGKDLSNIAMNIQYSDSDKILFRYKNRISLILVDNSEFGLLRLDLTFIKSSNIIDKIHDSNKTFEVELEYKPGTSKNIDKILNMINNEIKIVKQVLEKSEEIINKNEHNDVIKRYKK
jgi:hypothetical protein